MKHQITMEDEIKAEFKKNGFTFEDEEQTLKNCLNFCINYKLKPLDIVSSWKVYHHNRQINDSSMHVAEMDGFLLHLQSEQKDAILRNESHLHFYSSNDVDMILNGELASGETNPEAFDLTLEGSANDVYSPINPLNSENMKKEVIMNDEAYNIRRVQRSEGCLLVVHGSLPERGCRFMYNRIEDLFNALEERILMHARALLALRLYEDFVDPTIASQNVVFAVGMILCEEEEHLNEKSVLLQSSVEHSGGQSVRLDLQKIIQFSIFPGQVVGIEGHNLSGHCFVVSKLLDSIPHSNSTDLKHPPAKKKALNSEVQSPGFSSDLVDLSLMIAVGPFTTTDNFSFHHLTELLACAKRKMPQLLILVGPFVDSEHPDIKNEIVDKSFDDIFREEVLLRLHGHAKYMGSGARVILVPSIRDANHDFVFPQPAFDIHPDYINSQITATVNPCKFVANEVEVACSSVDILKHLSAVEFSRGGYGNGDRISRLAKHILDQRNFYPLYPQAECVPLDFMVAPDALKMSTIPDILILPSDLKHFVKVLRIGEGEEARSCLCVNPGRVCRGSGVGTFAEIEYHGSPETAVASIKSTTDSPLLTH